MHFQSHDLTRRVRTTLRRDRQPAIGVPRVAASIPALQFLVEAVDPARAEQTIRFRQVSEQKVAEEHTAPTNQEVTEETEGFLLSISVLFCLAPVKSCLSSVGSGEDQAVNARPVSFISWKLMSSPSGTFSNFM